jgi:predicted MFS family arabinose efflux permease
MFVLCLLITRTQLTLDGVATIPVALFSERYAMRQWPFISGIVIIIGSQIMLMEAQNFPVMCVAQLIQGMGSSLVWVVGLAIL